MTLPTTAMGCPLRIDRACPLSFEDYQAACPAVFCGWQAVIPSAIRTASPLTLVCTACITRHHRHAFRNLWSLLTRFRSGDNDKAEAEKAGGMSMYDKMFKATGGARMGMRARASQNGKLARTEGGEDGAGGAPNDSGNGAIKVEGGLGSTGHKRKRTVGMAGGSSGREEPDGVAGVVVKEEKVSGGGKAVADKGVKQETEALEASIKVERKRARSASKKAKRADKVAKEEEALAGEANSGDDDVQGGDAAASEKEQEKARRKREKKAKKRARKDA